MTRGFGRFVLVLAGVPLFVLAAQLASTFGAEPANKPAQAAAVDGRCDGDRISAMFAADSNTKVSLVKAFAKSQPLTLAGEADAQNAPNDLCVVKLMVGPGNPGPTDAPSTSQGVGIEIWLSSPANWNGRIHNIGSGGLDGIAEVSSLTKLGGLSMLCSGLLRADYAL